jgi:hypothetical protein
MLEYVLFGLMVLLFILFILQNSFDYRPFEKKINNIKVVILGPSNYYYTEDNLYFYKGLFTLNFEKDISPRRKTKSILLYFSEEKYQPDKLLKTLNFDHSLRSISLGCVVDGEISELLLLLAFDELKLYLEKNNYSDATIYIPLYESKELQEKDYPLIFRELKKTFANKINILS